MAKARERSRLGTKEVSVMIEMAADEVDTLKTKMAIPPTDDSAKWTWDSAGATGTALPTTVRAIIDVKKARQPVLTCSSRGRRTVRTGYT